MDPLPQVDLFIARELLGNHGPCLWGRGNGGFTEYLRSRWARNWVRGTGQGWDDLGAGKVPKFSSEKLTETTKISDSVLFL